MKQLPLFDTLTVQAPESDVCPDCGFGERVELEATEFYTAGYFYLCDCGYSTIQPQITYADFCIAIEQKRQERRGILDEIATLVHKASKATELSGIDPQVERVSSVEVEHARSMVTASMKMPKRTQTVAMQNYRRHQELLLIDDKLWREMSRLRIAFPCYSAWFDKES